MASYKNYEDGQSPPRRTGSFEEVEMEERDDDNDDGGQGDRLLPGGDVEGRGDVAWQEEWHLRTGWAIVGSILTVALVFLGMVLFTRTFIVRTGAKDVEMKGIGNFRRPASDYILNPNWDFNSARTVREYKWTITDIVANPDGVFRPMITINGLFPGPLIECNEGDTIVIDVDNQSVNATAIHFHGIYQNGTNHMDGTSGITQCPIAPKRKFRYEFTVNGQSGTYYYHGHMAVQASDGLFGPVVIHSEDERKLQEIPYVTDRIVMLQDYYHDVSSGLLKETLSPGSESSPIPNGVLLNGLNRRDCSKLLGKQCDNSSAALPYFNMAAGASHRLRFLNVGAFAWFQVEVDEHEFAITEADGTDLKPAYDTRLMIAPAQRYSVIINTTQTTGDAFWMRAKMVTHCWKEPKLPGPGADEVKAPIYYTSNDRRRAPLVTEPRSKAWTQAMAVQCRDMNTTSYVPAAVDPAPAVADHSYKLITNLMIGDWRLERGFINSSTLRPNMKHPTLHRTVEGLTSHNTSFEATQSLDGTNSVCYDEKNDFTIQHTGIKVIDIVVQNLDEGNHPMHLHGHKVWVLGQGHGYFPGYEKLGLKPEGRGILDGHEGILDNPLRRDVATVEGFGWLILRFVADNPGVWAFHCHMAWHSEAGLMMQFLSRVDEIATWEIPEANKRLCDADVGELEKGGAPKDSTWFGYGIED